MNAPAGRPVNIGDVKPADFQPLAPAIVDLRREEEPLQLSHGEFDRRIKAIARGLTNLGLPRGARIAIVSNNRVEYLLACFAILRAGFVCVPINHKLAPETIAFMFADSGIRFSFCDGERAALVPADVPTVDFDAADAFDRLLDPGPFETVAPGPDDVAMIMYTSGSTGRPKGVPILHSAQAWIMSVREKVTGRAGPYVTLVAAPFFHLNGLGSSMGAIGAGACAVLMPQFDPRRYLLAAARYRVSVVTAVPTMMAMVLREKDLLETLDFSSVTRVRVGSAPVTQALLDDLQRVFPNAVLANAYGVSEGGQLVFGPHPSGKPTPPIACGYPLPGVQTRLVDASGREARQGVLLIKSPAVMRGYLNMPEKTLEVLHDGWYRTGDIFRVDDDGFHYFVGRADDMFVCGGENIYPGAVEEMLEGHPAVNQACVVPVADELKGMKPVAFVVLKPGARESEASIKEYALRHGAAYQHPRMVVFVPELPLSGTKKIDRKALTRTAEELWSKTPS